MTTDLSALQRRHFLVGGTAAAFGLAGPASAQTPADGGVQPAAKALPGYVAWKDADAFVVHSNQTLETKRAWIGSGIVTPTERLFIRNNVNPPSDAIVADRDAWRIEIAGVTQPRTLTLGELKRMGLASVATVLQCSGNGRKYMQDSLQPGQKISGTPWTVGAAGCVIWTGVPLRAVVDALGGPAQGAQFVTGTGGEDLPAGLKPKDVMVERSVPLSTLDTVLLAWELNGEPIPLAHGGPLRMIVPGYSGVNNVKYVKAVALTERETDAKIQATSYRMHGVGEKGAPGQPSIWEQPVRSWITAPLGAGPGGSTIVTGVAFGGMNAVARVEVTADGGTTWVEAPLVGPDLGRYAWRLFAVRMDLPAGRHLLASRATDALGTVQPEDTPPNGGGYSYNGWRGPAVPFEAA